MFKSVADVDSYIAFRFLKRHFIAVRYLFANPAGQILGRRVEVEEVVEALVIKLLLHHFFYVAEIHDHAVLVEFFGAAEDRDNGVVAVEAAAFAFVGQGKPVCESYFYSFGDVIHAVFRLDGAKIGENLELAIGLPAFFSAAPSGLPVGEWYGGR